MKFGSGDAAWWSRAWGVLDILSMLSNQGRAKLSKLLAKLWDNLRPDKILDGCFRARIRVNVYVELKRRSVVPYKAPLGDEETYNILVFFSVMSNLRNCDCAADILFILGGT